MIWALKGYVWYVRCLTAWPGLQMISNAYVLSPACFWGQLRSICKWDLSKCRIMFKILDKAHSNAFPEFYNVYEDQHQFYLLALVCSLPELLDNPNECPRQCREGSVNKLRLGFVSRNISYPFIGWRTEARETRVRYMDFLKYLHRVAYTLFLVHINEIRSCRGWCLICHLGCLLPQGCWVPCWPE